jgi:hypothetical protein
MCRAVITYLALVTMVFSIVFAPRAAHCVTDHSKDDSMVCKRPGTHECRHKACPMKTKARSRHHDGPSERVCKTFIECAGGAQDRLNHASSDETVFLLSDSRPLRCRDGASPLPEHIASHLKEPALPVDIPPKL